jgi:hypothetical protein
MGASRRAVLSRDEGVGSQGVRDDHRVRVGTRTDAVHVLAHVGVESEDSTQVGVFQGAAAVTTLLGADELVYWIVPPRSYLESIRYPRVALTWPHCTCHHGLQRLVALENARMVSKSSVSFSMRLLRRLSVRLAIADLTRRSNARIGECRTRNRQTTEMSAQSDGCM